MRYNIGIHINCMHIAEESVFNSNIVGIQCAPSHMRVTTITKLTLPIDICRVKPNPVSSRVIGSEGEKCNKLNYV